MYHRRRQFPVISDPVYAPAVALSLPAAYPRNLPNLDSMFRWRNPLPISSGSSAMIPSDSGWAPMPANGRAGFLSFGEASSVLSFSAASFSVDAVSDSASVFLSCVASVDFVSGDESSSADCGVSAVSLAAAVVPSPSPGFPSCGVFGVRCSFVLGFGPRRGLDDLGLCGRVPRPRRPSVSNRKTNAEQIVESRSPWDSPPRGGGGEGGTSNVVHS